jgi:two-component system response regulator (stage 0 sporulation protein F)
MIVDDEPDLLRMVEHYLTKWQFQVAPFSDRLTALAEFQKNSALYPLIFADIRVPHMNGMELAKHMLRLKQDAKIMLMTAFDLDNIELASFLPIIKHSEILKKPFRLMEICNAVKKQLQIAY